MNYMINVCVRSPTNFDQKIPRDFEQETMQHSFVRLLNFSMYYTHMNVVAVMMYGGMH